MRCSIPIGKRGPVNSVVFWHAPVSTVAVDVDDSHLHQRIVLAVEETMVTHINLAIDLSNDISVRGH